MQRYRCLLNTTSDRSTYLTPRVTVAASCSRQSSPCLCSRASPGAGVTDASLRLRLPAEVGRGGSSAEAGRFRQELCVQGRFGSAAAAAAACMCARVCRQPLAP